MLVNCVITRGSRLARPRLARVESPDTRSARSEMSAAGLPRARSSESIRGAIASESLAMCTASALPTSSSPVAMPLSSATLASCMHTRAIPARCAGVRRGPDHAASRPNGARHLASSISEPMSTVASPPPNAKWCFAGTAAVAGCVVSKLLASSKRRASPRHCPAAARIRAASASSVHGEKSTPTSRSAASICSNMASVTVFPKNETVPG
mmetsp:Transcript_21499/g.74080  ORF Transcript_21499/g.74080 Transcript_21499/m.74080 type:complete len:210 (+) Transcript_21499:1311-1940(+)